MVLNDPLANALSKIGQYEHLGKAECIIEPSSTIISHCLGLLKKFGYIKGYNKVKDGRKEHLIVKLHGKINSCGVIKPRFAIKKDNFEKYEQRYLPAKDMGIMIVSTVEGMVDHSTAKQKKLGGRLIAYCY
ncbi:30S ribosomal protein S8 [Candidatus Woesearchaeota archaeon]|nr:30S ribosomal protein S8 [Candidatus Woesearchaeota archaeon]